MQIESGKSNGSHDQNDTKLHLFMRLLIVAGFFTMLIILKFTGALSFQSPVCIEDSFFELTASMNQYLAQRGEVLNSLIIVTSLNIDASMVFFAFLFVYYYRSWRLAIWAGMFYPCRSVIQSFFGMRIPASYEWRYPGFPSIFVPYSMGDFFYSGHAGLMLALCIEFYQYKYYWISFFVALMNVYNCIILVVTRSHYSVDIVGGLVFSHYFYLLAGYVCKALERVGIYDSVKMQKCEQSEELQMRSNVDESQLFFQDQEGGVVRREEHINSSASSYEGSLKQKLIASKD